MLSWAFRFRFWQYVKASLWLVPTLGLIAGVVLARWAVVVDGTGVLPSSWTYAASTASSVLSSIVGAMIALLGFVVTIGILVVQQATGTLSPRYMRLWYRDHLQKTVLATFAGTFAFAFSLLSSIGEDTVPDLGVTLAGLGVAVSLVLLLVYLNRFSHNLRPVAIAALVGSLGRGLIADLTAAGRSANAFDARALPDGPATPVAAERGGAIQAFDVHGLIALASRHECTIVLTHPVGDFLPPGAILAQIYGGTTQPDPRRVSGKVALGLERTIEQDPAFALRVLVDIATRALSPAVNDPTTAVQVLDHIEAFLHTLDSSALRRRHVVSDERGRPLLVVPDRSWQDYLQLAVGEIRDYGATSVQVCRRLRALLDRLLETVPDPDRAAVGTELRRLDAAVERAFDDLDQRAVAMTGDRQGIGTGGKGEDGAGPGEGPLQEGL
ncbi:DUF2254 domain-containing protein [Kitasatospora herbaricolor]|uniref:DUF2254 domain-containing protein n=1 Tax=Kitasatospora herbaricolor TaxID=68217 RepID=UPI0036D8592C